jgi:hypothetical protein
MLALVTELPETDTARTLLLCAQTLFATHPVRPLAPHATACVPTLRPWRS